MLISTSRLFSSERTSMRARRPVVLKTRLCRDCKQSVHEGVSLPFSSTCVHGTNQSIKFDTNHFIIIIIIIIIIITYSRPSLHFHTRNIVKNKSPCVIGKLTFTTGPVLIQTVYNRIKLFNYPLLRFNQDFLRVTMESTNISGQQEIKMF